MKQGVCHPDLPTASGWSNSPAHRFIFQIVDLWPSMIHCVGERPEPAFVTTLGESCAD
jgi:hypothetical protein